MICESLSEPYSQHATTLLHAKYLLATNTDRGRKAIFIILRLVSLLTVVL